MSSKDLNQFIHRLRRAGAEPRLSKGGHWIIKTPNGGTVVCAKTPRNAGQTIRNATARLRNGGVVI